MVSTDWANPTVISCTAGINKWEATETNTSPSGAYNTGIANLQRHDHTSFLIENDSNQSITVQLYTSRNADMTKAATLGSSFTVAAGAYTVNDIWAEVKYVRATITPAGAATGDVRATLLSRQFVGG